MQILKTTQFKYVNYILNKNIMLKKQGCWVVFLAPTLGKTSCSYFLGRIDMSFEPKPSKENDYNFILYY